MGNKLESVKKKSQEGVNSFKELKRMGDQTVGEVKSMKQIADSLPSDVDDEILDAARAVKEGTKKDATDYMHNTVETNLKEGQKHMDSSTSEARDQIGKNEKTSDAFKQMDGVAGFGRGARADGQAKIDKSTQEFNTAADTNTKEASEAESDFGKKLSDISSTF